MTKCSSKDDENKIQPGSNSQELDNVRVSYSRICFQNNKSKQFSKAPTERISVEKNAFENYKNSEDCFCKEA